MKALASLIRRIALGCAFLIPSVYIFHPADSAADTVIFQQSAPKTGQLTTTYNEEWAQGFTVGATPMTLTSVSLQLEAAGPNNHFFVDLYSNNAGTPGTLLETLSGNNNPVAGGTFTYTSSGTLLSANTSYWIADRILVTDTGAFTYWDDVTTATPPSVGTSIGLAASFNSGAWSLQPGNTTVMTVSGVTPTPEPSPFALAAISSVWMLGAVRRRSKRN